MIPAINKKSLLDEQIKYTISTFILSRSTPEFTKEELFEHIQKKHSCANIELIESIWGSSLKRFQDRGLIRDDFNRYLIKNPVIY